MGFNIARDYLDRDKERARFHKMRAGQMTERILVILVPGEKGKSCLLSRLRYECEQESCPIPLALLNFDPDKGTLRDEISVAQEIRRCFGDTHVPHLCECLDEITRPQPLVHIQTGEGEAGVDFGRRGRFEEAEVSQVTGRDNISLGPVIGSALTPVQLAAQKDALGRALRDDLAALGQPDARAVILIDTFEKVSAEMRTWLERWLFEPLCREILHVMLVIAGRPETPEFSLRAYFERPHRWGYLNDTVEGFPPFTHNEVQTFFNRQGFPVSLEEHRLLAVACENPAFMHLMVDKLRQIPGGA